MNEKKLLLQQAAINLLVAVTIVQPGLAAMLADSSDSPHLQPQVLAYEPPARGAPGDRGDAGSRDDIHHFLALIPALNLGLTAIAHPTFWLYLPAPFPDDIPLEFVLRDEQQNVIFRTIFEIETTAGIASFCLPPDSDPLEIGKKYNWYFFCGNISRHGWIERVAMKPEILVQLEAASLRQRVLMLAEQGLWYDTIAELVALRDKLLSQLQAANLEERLVIYAENDLRYEALAELSGFDKISSLATLEADWEALLQHPFVRLHGIVSPPFV
ncbi:DUF928 domain-containing protein [Microcoleus sp. CAWBG58]|uniref:DUF928 domain-containing protein n=1 Tax=Microcoleus sp. CAWBG58 TaxID=2841651 RepID=UPI0025E80924|nr:DUF928 domain-containing protein [Microcoleus sp. CAWBG58]